MSKMRALKVGLLNRALWAVLLSSSASVSVSRSADSVADFKDALEKRLNFIFKDEKLARTQIGASVYSLSRQESLYDLNADKALSAASVIKLLTSLVALKRLGPDFVFKTEIYTDGSVQQGVLNGNLYLKGGGDPSLVTERLFLLVNDLAREGIESVQGDIIVDDWTFGQVKIDPGRIVTNTDRAYNAPVGGLSFNYNTTTVYFRPGDLPGSKLRVYAEPDTGYLKILNKGNTGGRGSGNSLVASRNKGDFGDSLAVKGSLGLGSAEQRSYFNITQPQIYAGFALRYLMMNRGIKFSKSSSVKHAQTPLTARKLSVLESLPLREIVTLMNKFSNNFIAESLVKTLGREFKGAPGTTEKGIAVIMEEATKLDINTSGFNLVSGSGLTRENRTSARQFVKLLNAAYLDFDVLPELLSSLPIAGKDGTLRRRLSGTSAYGRLRAKTGSIDGVSALAGVVQSRNGELLAFAVIMNDKAKVPGAMHPWQNYFAQTLADFNRKTPLSEKPTAIPATLEEADENVETSSDR